MKHFKLTSSYDYFRFIDNESKTINKNYSAISRVGGKGKLKNIFDLKY